MALRVRKNGVTVCAAQSKPEEGDTYINDRQHYEMAQAGKVKTKTGKIWYTNRR